MRRRMRTTLTLTAASLASALAVGLAAAPAQAADPVGPPQLLRESLPGPEAFADTFAHGRERTRWGERWRAAKELDAALADAMAGVPVGATARVDVPGLRWSGADGIRELGERAPARPTDEFRVGSITKPMVATLVLQEVERGTWSLDTPVTDVLPAAADVVPPRYRDRVTLETLLSHTSGLPDHILALLDGRVDDPTDIDQQFAAMAQEYTTADHLGAMTQPWLFEPGTDYSYSNAGYVLLGLALEEATGRDLGTLLERRVFAPAHMWRTDFPDDPRADGPFLVGAAYTGDLGARWYSQDRVDPSLFDAAGAVTSTTGDLQRFTDALLDGDLLERATVEDMLTPRSDAAEYGLGIYRLPDPCDPSQFLYGHDGATFGTISATFTSADGRREYTAALTGRDFTVEEQTDLNDVLVRMIGVTC